MSKPFFYRITAADFLAAVVTVPEQERATWVLSLALDMVAGDVDKAKSEFAKNIIIEAAEFSGKKRAAANKRWSKEYKQIDAPDMQSDAVHKHSNARSSNNSSTVTEEPLIPCENDFDSLWKQYPKKDGRKASLRHFTASVKTTDDLSNIQKALDNYILSVNGVETKFIKNGSTWFNNWQDWVDWKPEQNSGKGKMHIPNPIGGFRESDI